MLNNHRLLPSCFAAYCYYDCLPRDGYMLNNKCCLLPCGFAAYCYYDCLPRDGYMLKGNNTTQCFFGNWTGMTPWCKEGKITFFSLIYEYF